ncbi:alpha/beta fold hydrolase [Salinimicrobium catena]|uniref:alpha/beta fold hydrolase n=1 Tax=Salinimicrobium catena TaxID=390640 RepID=UPI002FE4589B
MLHTVLLTHFNNSAGTEQDIAVHYESFGPSLGTAPVVLVNHSLTGNSEVTGSEGWWKEIVGPGKCIDTSLFTVLSINVPGNGAGGGKDLLENYSEFTLADIAKIFLEVLKELKIKRLYAIIGGSIGGALAWEMAALNPAVAQNIIPIAAHLRTSDWVRAQCKVQEQILNNSADPVHDARLHAMTLYRTPQSFAAKFRRNKNEGNGLFEVENWLLHHGKKLRERFHLSAYKLMNHLLTTIDISRGSGDQIAAAAKIEGKIHIIGIDSDLFFTSEENRATYRELKKVKKEVFYSEMVSPHGHDAFLIEYEQLECMLSPIFKTNNSVKNEEDTHSAVWHG